MGAMMSWLTMSEKWEESWMISVWMTLRAMARRGKGERLGRVEGMSDVSSSARTRTQSYSSASVGRITGAIPNQHLSIDLVSSTRKEKHSPEHGPGSGEGQGRGKGETEADAPETSASSHPHGRPSSTQTGFRREARSFFPVLPVPERYAESSGCRGWRSSWKGDGLGELELETGGELGR